MMSMRSFLALCLVWPVYAQHQLARDVFKELIEINTTDSTGDNTRAAEAMAARFRAAGFPDRDIQVLAPAPRKGNLIVRYRGSGAERPILFLGHLDVVEALRSDWSFDPFVFREQDGYYYGRGTQDMKGDDAVLVANFIRLKKEGFVPARDLILALTADEETGQFNGVDWLLKNHRELIDAEYCVNSDGGGGAIRNGRRQYFGVEAAEKTYLSFELKVTNSGGHSSLPRKDNAIYQLADGLSRLAKFEFPVELNDITRAYFERMAAIETGQRAADMKAIVQNPRDRAAAGRLSESPSYNALLRTTCVATMLSGGHAENALPETAKAMVNCRLLPGDSAQNVERTLKEVVADPKIAVTPARPTTVSPASVPGPKFMGAVKTAAAALWPGVPVILFMEAGATDGRLLRNAGIPTYAVSGVFLDQDDIRAHGRDERVPVESFNQAVDFFYGLIRELAGSK